MSGMTRYGIIGCGEISLITCQGIAAARHAQIKMVMDLNPELSGELGEKYQIASTTDLDELLGSETIDAVYIAVPHFLHKQAAVKSALAGKHVLLEKPIGLNMDEANEIVAATAKADVRVGVAMVRRYCREVLEIRRLIAAGAIGEVVATFIPVLKSKKASYWQGGFTGRNPSDWRRKRATSGGGVLIMNVFHDLDAMNFMTGLQCVGASGLYGTYATRIEVEDYITASLKYDNGAIGTVIASSAVPGHNPPGHNVCTRIFGKTGQIVLDGNDILLYTSVAIAETEPNQWNKIQLETPAEQHVIRAEMVDEFSLAVRAGEPSRIDIDQVINTRQICDWVYDYQDQPIATDRI